MWKQPLLEHAIQPIQQFRYTTGKNATDSDFTRLASRIRESGRRVYGFGEKKTPRPFVATCDRFIYTEVFTQPVVDDSATASKPPSARLLRSDTKLLTALREAIEANSDEMGWASLGPVGTLLNMTVNDFDPRNYGFKKLSELVQAMGLFEVERREKTVYVRDGRKK